MVTKEIYLTAPRAPGWVNRVFFAAMHWWQTYRKWKTRRRYVRELRALNDHILKDIGVARSEIRRVVMENVK